MDSTSCFDRTRSVPLSNSTTNEKARPSERRIYKGTVRIEREWISDEFDAVFAREVNQFGVISDKLPR